MQTDQLPNPNNEYSTPAQFRSKLGSYLTGVLIGFTLLGMIYLMKSIATKGQPAPNAQQSTPTQTEPSP